MDRLKQEFKKTAIIGSIHLSLIIGAIVTYLISDSSIVQVAVLIINMILLIAIIPFLVIYIEMFFMFTENQRNDMRKEAGRKNALRMKKLKYSRIIK